MHSAAYYFRTHWTRHIDARTGAPHGQPLFIHTTKYQLHAAAARSSTQQQQQQRTMKEPMYTTPFHCLSGTMSEPRHVQQQAEARASAAAAAAHHERTNVHHPLPLLLQRAPVALPRLPQRHRRQHHEAKRHVACGAQCVRAAGSVSGGSGGWQGQHGRRRQQAPPAAKSTSSSAAPGWWAQPLSHDVRRKGKRKPYTPSDHLFSRLRLELRLQGGAGVVQAAAGAAVSCGPTSSAACVLHMQAVIASSGYAVARWKSAGLRPAGRGSWRAGAAAL